MAFNSFHFLVYFPVVLALYFLLPYKLRPGVLLAASLYFYAAWRPPYLLLFLAAVAISYYAGLLIHREPDATRKKRYLQAGIAILLANLFFFKYFNFANESLATVFGWMRLPYEIPNLDLILPIGISFYTFQKISYMIEVYRGIVPPETSLFRFTLFASFFPQLVAGPIERAKDLLPQMTAHADFDYQRVRSGLQLMLWGFFKKIVIADRLGPFVERVYGAPGTADGISITLATFFFMWQIYCDFSGYSDIAIGAAQTLGITLTKNFNRPYFATSVPDFWKRWHITLSSWLSDYVFTPFSRTRFLNLKWSNMILASLFVTFVTSGVWHGAQWTFVLWGALHGLYMVASFQSQKFRMRMVKRLKLKQVPKLHFALKIAMTFSLVMFSEIFFRAASVADAWRLIARLGTGWVPFLAGQIELAFTGREVLAAMALIGVLVGIEILQAGGSLRAKIAAQPAWFRWGLYYAETASILMLGALYETNSQFIYFQF